MIYAIFCARYNDRDTTKDMVDISSGSEWRDEDQTDRA